MFCTITQARSLRGRISMPGDKSISHRAVMIGSISDGLTEIDNFTTGSDCQATLQAMVSLGVEITRSQGRLLVHGRGLRGLRTPPGPLDAGNSATMIRLLSGILAGQSFESIIYGDHYLNKRPMRRIIEPLRMMGADISGVDDEYPPLRIRGGDLRPIRYRTPVPSAQVKSAILLAGLYADGTTTVIEEVKSRDHTERMLQACGAWLQSCRSEAGFQISIRGNPALSGQRVVIPGDISSAAFFLVAALLVPDSEVVIEKVGLNPTRSGIIDVLREMGGDISVENTDEISGEPVADLVVRSSALKGTTINGEMIPRLIDEIPILAIAATQADGEVLIAGARELRKKEADRISVMVENLNRMGGKVRELPDGMVIEGVTPLSGALIDSAGDHRIAMAFAVAGLLARGETRISGWEWTRTSFPEFLKILNSLRSG